MCKIWYDWCQAVSAGKGASRVDNWRNFHEKRKKAFGIYKKQEPPLDFIEYRCNRFYSVFTTLTKICDFDP